MSLTQLLSHIHICIFIEPVNPTQGMVFLYGLGKITRKFRENICKNIHFETILGKIQMFSPKISHDLLQCGQGAEGRIHHIPSF